MSFVVESSLRFGRQAKRLLKKYPSLTGELALLMDDLAKEPHQGTPLGKNLYKIRLAVKSKGAGRSGGARVITCVKIVSRRVIMAAIYDKPEVETMTDRELAQVVIENMGP